VLGCGSAECNSHPHRRAVTDDYAIRAADTEDADWTY
jgi:hypothetical protein